MRVPGSVSRWFLQLQPQEQRALKLLGVFLGAVMLWYGMWLPVQGARDRHEQSYRVALADLRWMKSQEGAAKAAPVVNDAGQGESLLSVATGSAQRFHIALSHAEPAEAGRLHVSLESVAFDALMLWLDALQREAGVHAVRVSFERQAERSGYVRVTLVLAQ